MYWNWYWLVIVQISSFSSLNRQLRILICGNQKCKGDDTVMKRWARFEICEQSALQLQINNSTEQNKNRENKIQSGSLSNHWVRIATQSLAHSTVSSIGLCSAWLYTSRCKWQSCNKLQTMCNKHQRRTENVSPSHGRKSMGCGAEMSQLLDLVPRQHITLSLSLSLSVSRSSRTHKANEWDHHWLSLTGAVGLWFSFCVNCKTKYTTTTEGKLQLVWAVLWSETKSGFGGCGVRLSFDTCCEYKTLFMFIVEKCLIIVAMFLRYSRDHMNWNW